MNVRHEPENRRFVVALDDSLAVLEYSSIDDGTLDYTHTFVPPALRGRGIASNLAEHALQYALDNRLTVVPSCPFIAAFISSNPQYRKVLEN
jgi:hypothetical protein